MVKDNTLLKNEEAGSLSEDESETYVNISIGINQSKPCDANHDFTGSMTCLPVDDIANSEGKGVENSLAISTNWATFIEPLCDTSKTDIDNKINSSKVENKEETKANVLIDKMIGERHQKSHLTENKYGRPTPNLPTYDKKDKLIKQLKPDRTCEEFLCEDDLRSDGEIYSSIKNKRSHDCSQEIVRENVTNCVISPLLSLDDIYIDPEGGDTTVEPKQELLLRNSSANIADCQDEYQLNRLKSTTKSSEQDNQSSRPQGCLQIKNLLPLIPAYVNVGDFLVESTTIQKDEDVSCTVDIPTQDLSEKSISTNVSIEINLQKSDNSERNSERDQNEEIVKIEELIKYAVKEKIITIGQLKKLLKSLKKNQELFDNNKEEYVIICRGCMVNACDERINLENMIEKALKEKRITLDQLEKLIRSLKENRASETVSEAEGRLLESLDEVIKFQIDDIIINIANVVYTLVSIEQSEKSNTDKMENGTNEVSSSREFICDQDSLEGTNLVEDQENKESIINTPEKKLFEDQLTTDEQATENKNVFTNEGILDSTREIEVAKFTTVENPESEVFDRYTDDEGGSESAALSIEVETYSLESAKSDNKIRPVSRSGKPQIPDLLRVQTELKSVFNSEQAKIKTLENFLEGARLKDEVNHEHTGIMNDYISTKLFLDQKKKKKALIPRCAPTNKFTRTMAMCDMRRSVTTLGIFEIDKSLNQHREKRHSEIFQNLRLEHDQNQSHSETIINRSREHLVPSTTSYIGEDHRVSNMNVEGEVLKKAFKDVKISPNYLSSSAIACGTKVEERPTSTLSLDLQKSLFERIQFLSELSNTYIHQMQNISQSFGDQIQSKEEYTCRSKSINSLKTTAELNRISNLSDQLLARCSIKPDYDLQPEKRSTYPKESPLEETQIKRERNDFENKYKKSQNICDNVCCLAYEETFCGRTSSNAEVTPNQYISKSFGRSDHQLRESYRNMIFASAFLENEQSINKTNDEYQTIFHQEYDKCVDSNNNMNKSSNRQFDSFLHENNSEYDEPFDELDSPFHEMDTTSTMIESFANVPNVSDEALETVHEILSEGDLSVEVSVNIYSKTEQLMDISEGYACCKGKGMPDDVEDESVNMSKDNSKHSLIGSIIETIKEKAAKNEVLSSFETVKESIQEFKVVKEISSIWGSFQQTMPEISFKKSIWGKKKSAPVGDVL